jgi:hypothetical protein
VDEAPPIAAVRESTPPDRQSVAAKEPLPPRDKFGDADLNPSTRPSPNKRSLQTSLQIATLGVALVATAIGAVGYGAGLAAEKLGASTWPLVSSPLDAFALFTQTAPRFVVANATVVDRWFELIPQLWVRTLHYGAAIGLLLLILWFVRPAIQARSKQKRPYLVRVRSWLLSRRWAASLLKVSASLAAAGMGGVVVVLVGALLFETAIVLVAVLPLLGYSLGELHIKESVIAPEGCGGTYTRAQHLGLEPGRPVDGPKALCVEIRKDDRVLGQGRVVFSTPDKVLVYQPRSGALAVIPTEGAVVTIVGALFEDAHHASDGPPRNVCESRSETQETIETIAAVP